MYLAYLLKLSLYPDSGTWDRSWPLLVPQCISKTPPCLHKNSQEEPHVKLCTHNGCTTKKTAMSKLPASAVPAAVYSTTCPGSTQSLAYYVMAPVWTSCKEAWWQTMRDIILSHCQTASQFTLKPQALWHVAVRVLVGRLREDDSWRGTRGKAHTVSSKSYQGWGFTVEPAPSAAIWTGGLGGQAAERSFCLLYIQLLLTAALNHKNMKAKKSNLKK